MGETLTVSHHVLNNFQRLSYNDLVEGALAFSKVLMTAGSNSNRGLSGPRATPTAGDVPGRSAKLCPPSETVGPF